MIIIAAYATLRSFVHHHKDVKEEGGSIFLALS